jgi:hypothetical protein
MRFCPDESQHSGKYQCGIGRSLEFPELTLPAVVAEYFHFRRVMS